MDISITGVDFTLTGANQTLINDKIEHRIKYAEDLIVDLSVKVREEKNSFKFDSNINFRWGLAAHVSVEDQDFAAGVNKLMDVLDQKIKKEKDKVQQR